MEQTISDIRQQFLQDMGVVRTLADLEVLKIKYLGKKGLVQQLMNYLKDSPPGDRPALGKKINEIKDLLTSEIELTEGDLIRSEQEKRLHSEKIDESLPGRRRFAGRKHVVTEALDEILDILIGMGFSVQYGPDIDTDYYNFEALNFPQDHPARDMQDTFYISPHVLLRTHTSNIQARILETQKPPIRIIAPGRAYRNETITARSHVFFHQVEGFYVDKGVTFKDLLSTMTEFYRKLFRKDVEMRFRPSYFPFVEPGQTITLVFIGNNCKARSISSF